jgi:hypothetical protein
MMKLVRSSKHHLHHFYLKGNSAQEFGIEGGTARRPSIRHALPPRHGIPSHALPQKAQNEDVLSFIHQNCANFHMSLYADDAAVFINLTTHNLQATEFIL